MSPGGPPPSPNVITDKLQGSPYQLKFGSKIQPEKVLIKCIGGGHIPLRKQCLIMVLTCHGPLCPIEKVFHETL